MTTQVKNAQDETIAEYPGGHPDSIHVLMSKVMGQVQAVGKAQRVTGARGYAFRGVDDVVNAVGPALRDYGVVVVPHAVHEVREERYSTGSGTAMHGVIVRIKWRFYGPAGDFIEAESAGQSSDSGDKAVPKAHSVAYRTVLLQALCIPTDEPDPDTNVHDRAPADPNAAERTKALAELGEYADSSGEDRATLAAQFTVEVGGDIRQADPDAIRKFTAKLREAKDATIATEVSGG